MSLNRKDVKVESWPETPRTGMLVGGGISSKGVKATHKPTGIAVKCDEKRSQHANLAIAMEQLEELVKIYVEKY